MRLPRPLQVKAEVQSLNARLAPIETNAAKAATGIEVLCELVQSSGLLANASADSLRRLDSFTGAEAPPPQPPARELLPPATAHADLGGGLLRAIMAEPPSVRAQ